MAEDPFEVISRIRIAETEIGGSVAMRVLSALDAAGLVVVQKPTYSIDAVTEGGEQSPPPKPTLRIV